VVCSSGAQALPPRQARRSGRAREDGDGARVGGNTHAVRGAARSKAEAVLGRIASPATFRQERRDALGGLGGAPP